MRKGCHCHSDFTAGTASAAGTAMTGHPESPRMSPRPLPDGYYAPRFVADELLRFMEKQGRAVSRWP